MCCHQLTILRDSTQLCHVSRSTYILCLFVFQTNEVSIQFVFQTIRSGLFGRCSQGNNSMRPIIQSNHDLLQDRIPWTWKYIVPKWTLLLFSLFKNRSLQQKWKVFIIGTYQIAPIQLTINEMNEYVCIVYARDLSLFDVFVRH